jgi:hypothetical protein
LENYARKIRIQIIFGDLFEKYIIINYLFIFGTNHEVFNLVIGVNKPLWKNKIKRG